MLRSSSFAIVVSLTFVKDDARGHGGMEGSTVAIETGGAGRVSRTSVVGPQDRARNFGDPLVLGLHAAMASSVGRSRHSLSVLPIDPQVGSMPACGSTNTDAP